MRPASSASYWPSALHLPQVSRARNGGTDVSAPTGCPACPNVCSCATRGSGSCKSGIMCLNRASETRKTWKIRPATCPAWAKLPNFEAETAHRRHIRFPQDFKGKWIKFLFSHPGDFTPVCTSEFMLFGKMREGSTLPRLPAPRTLRRRPDQPHRLAALDPRKIEYKGIRNLDIRFPLIADLTMDVARRYGMIQPGASTTAAVRTVFFIDPHGIVRTFLLLPGGPGPQFRRAQTHSRGASDHRRLQRGAARRLASRRRRDRPLEAPRWKRSTATPAPPTRRRPLLRLVLLHPSPSPREGDRRHEALRDDRMTSNTKSSLSRLLFSLNSFDRSCPNSHFLFTFVSKPPLTRI